MCSEVRYSYVLRPQYKEKAVGTLLLGNFDARILNKTVKTNLKQIKL